MKAWSSMRSSQVALLEPIMGMKILLYLEPTLIPARPEGPPSTHERYAPYYEVYQVYSNDDVCQPLVDALALPQDRRRK
ncbi:hypothetical protein ACH5RR_021626 [Cinchona calisaya]|uniref:Uncharacterized protein n=1 Tax=Cinchona calisaya TaxID=153742 RepID=A0ABD2ZKS1_9GENT